MQWNDTYYRSNIYDLLQTLTHILLNTDIVSEQVLAMHYPQLSLQRMNINEEFQNTMSSQQACGDLLNNFALQSLIIEYIKVFATAATYLKKF